MNLVISQKHLFVKPTLDITTIFRRIIAILLWVHIASHAVFLNGPPITAIKVPNNSIVVDGRPDLIWKAIASRSGTKSTLKFDDYSKIVLLQADSIRNSDPTKYFQAPVLGSVDMFAAYDNTALYFFFLVNENTLFNPATLCTATNLWKANAPEVYVDPSPWSPDNYQAFFSADGTGLLNGTSPKTIQLDKPIFSKDSRLFFRNRLTPPDRFQIPASTPNGVLAVASQHSASDSLVVGVEMKIPFWTGTATDFGAGKSIFISWGYNHYPNGAKSTCDSTPIAYRWAKNYKSYLATDPNKPVGWRKGDSTHYDPTRSWDGWGQFYLSPVTVSSSNCNNPVMDTTVWNPLYWSDRCGGGAATQLRSQGVLKIGNKNSGLKIEYPWDHSNHDAKGRSSEFRPSPVLNP